MVKTLMLSLLVIIAGLLLAMFMARDPGYVLLAYGNHTFETSLLALLLAGLTLLLLAKLLMLLVGLLNPRRYFGRRRL